VVAFFLQVEAVSIRFAFYGGVFIVSSPLLSGMNIDRGSQQGHQRAGHVVAVRSLSSSLFELRPSVNLLYSTYGLIVIILDMLRSGF
jgi:drug/metabolite transporter superfamily protein YnfA